MSRSLDETQKKRRAAMAVLAESRTAEIAHLLERLAPLPAFDDLRAPENGLVMIRGRIGGDGAQFNLGEATVSRAVVRLATGEMGFGYVLGRDRTKARLIALCDALVQTVAHSAAVERQVVAPLRARLEEQRDVRARQVAATKVDFFTLVRGEDSA
ncbi:MAG TPA: phosphonate C-P lyase system protein PhnG [Xanthobacteraceae bacterium]|nr:phosphonate C-P lyase system protein PhnG [Xanthobacteraceae bacterium]